VARNVEIKARVADAGALRAAAAEVADRGPFELVQDDTFFACAAGRLKLRVAADGTGELIAYRRADVAGPKASHYLRTPVADPDAMRAALALAGGVIGRVRKRRTLFLAGRTRIHLDRVEGLGDFVELEVVLGDGEAVEAGVAEADDLMARLGIAADALVEGAYLDLLVAGAGAGATAPAPADTDTGSATTAAGIADAAAATAAAGDAATAPAPAILDFARADAPRPTLHLLCGRIAAGKSTFAGRLAAAPRTVRFDEDRWLATLFPGAIATLDDYRVHAARLEAALGPQVEAVLRAGLDVVMDFHANTRARRAWLKGLAERAGAVPRLHLLDVPEATCLARLHARNARGDHPYRPTDEEFAIFSRYFQHPEDDEGLAVVVHED
jgi:predicted adenylyl cyclase CyaB